MCDKVAELVPIPDLLWQAGAIYDFSPTHPEYGIDAEGRKCLAIDACIVPAIRTLWEAGVVTMSCCCGHGGGWGVITIQTEEIKGRVGAMVVRVEDYDALTADRGAATARAEALELEVAELRTALDGVVDYYDALRMDRATEYARDLLNRPTGPRGAAMLAALRWYADPEHYTVERPRLCESTDGRMAPFSYDSTDIREDAGERARRALAHEGGA